MQEILWWIWYLYADEPFMLLRLIGLHVQAKNALLPCANGVI
jgi:hypothetical protein